MKAISASNHTTPVLLALAALPVSNLAAFAGEIAVPAPAPLAGAFGPAGLIAFGAAYGGAKLIKHYRNRK